MLIDLRRRPLPILLHSSPIARLSKAQRKRPRAEMRGQFEVMHSVQWGAIFPCTKPPSLAGFRTMARRDADGVRLVFHQVSAV